MGYGLGALAISCCGLVTPGLRVGMGLAWLSSLRPSEPTSGLNVPPGLTAGLRPTGVADLCSNSGSWGPWGGLTWRREGAHHPHGPQKPAAVKSIHHSLGVQPPAPHHLQVPGWGWSQQGCAPRVGFRGKGAAPG